MVTHLVCIASLARPSITTYADPAAALANVAGFLGRAIVTHYPKPPSCHRPKKYQATNQRLGYFVSAAHPLLASHTSLVADRPTPASQGRPRRYPSSQPWLVAWAREG
ncbi:hypothetical protein DM01DRAFT_1337452 [Hesseltinella vesiculosa]|uniref:Uncharacterized protein n=1 Tax=Hesseltinella vesiculosa TaxID=101127 RepID=A0A1X2GCR3_9FUNG|nr:hypothetical protein DM01DRAFT_1337452 [Hesseltinella vesiculosa]